MNEKQTTIDEYYYPQCLSKGCNGLLRFTINSNDLSLDYECDKNKSHTGQNISFKTFEENFLKKQSIKSCSEFKSISLENIRLSSNDIDINEIKNNIIKRAKSYEMLKNTIFEWEELFRKKLEDLKLKLKNEIELFEKIINNYNDSFNNKTYIDNIKYINDYFERNYNHKNLKDFYYSSFSKD